MGVHQNPPALNEPLDQYPHLAMHRTAHVPYRDARVHVDTNNETTVHHAHSCTKQTQRRLLLLLLLSSPRLTRIRGNKHIKHQILCINNDTLQSKRVHHYYYNIVLYYISPQFVIILL